MNLEKLSLGMSFKVSKVGVRPRTPPTMDHNEELSATSTCQAIHDDSGLISETISKTPVNCFLLHKLPLLQYLHTATEQ